MGVRMKKPMIFAHRGASWDAPENTMPAFRLAMSQPADGIELDVHLTQDGIPVVIHDETADRTGTRSGRVVDRPLAWWREGDFGVWKHPSFAGTTLPTLEEVLALLAPWHGWLNIELKTDVIRYEGIEQKVLDLVARAGMRQRVVISSFHHQTLAVCHQVDPEVETAALVGRKEAIDERALVAQGIRAIHPHGARVTPAEVRRWHALGWQVRPWTIDWRVPALLETLMGVDAIITNRPKQIAACLWPFRRTQGENR